MTKISEIYKEIVQGISKASIVGACIGGNAGFGSHVIVSHALLVACPACARSEPARVNVLAAVARGSTSYRYNIGGVDVLLQVDINSSRVEQQVIPGASFCF